MNPGAKRVFKSLAIGVVGLAIVLAAAAFVVLETPLLLSDLSTDDLGTRDDGLALRARMQDAHGGLTPWRVMGRARARRAGARPGRALRLRARR